MSEVLTMDEIKRRYDGEWLLIACTEQDEDLNVVRGEVIAHSPDRDVIYRQLLSPDIQQPGQSLAIEYVGPIPPDYAVML